LRREEYVFKHKDINSNLYSDVIGLFRWWVYGMVVEILLFLTVGLTYIVPDLEKYQGYTAEFLNSTAQIGEFFLLRRCSSCCFVRDDGCSASKV